MRVVEVELVGRIVGHDHDHQDGLVADELLVAAAALGLGRIERSDERRDRLLDRAAAGADLGHARELLQQVVVVGGEAVAVGEGRAVHARGAEARGLGHQIADGGAAGLVAGVRVAGDHADVIRVDLLQRVLDRGDEAVEAVEQLGLLRGHAAGVVDDEQEVDRVAALIEARRRIGGAAEI
ncbi:MAG: hypothetical protein U0168_31515, partial [Nannocystaceae bacterium]